MWGINWPTSMDSEWGRKPYWSGGIAFGTSTERLLRAANCLTFSPAALDGAEAATGDEKESQVRTTTANKARRFMGSPQDIFSTSGFSYLKRERVSRTKTNRQGARIHSTPLENISPTKPGYKCSAVAPLSVVRLART